MEISIIIPAYNEDKIILDSINNIKNYLEQNNFDYEIIVVDDGSTDKTRELVKTVLNDKIKINPSRINRGKGFSVKEGVLLSTKKLVLFTDADLSAPIDQLEKMLSFLDNFDLVIGSRAVLGSDVKTKWYRKLLGRAGNKIISLVLVDGIEDTQCGFKLFKSEVAKELFPKLIVDRWGFDFELLYLAKKNGFSIKEVPVSWVIGAETKVKPTDVIKVFIDLLRVKMRHR